MTDKNLTAAEAITRVTDMNHDGACVLQELRALGFAVVSAETVKRACVELRGYAADHSGFGQVKLAHQLLDIAAELEKR